MQIYKIQLGFTWKWYWCLRPFFNLVFDLWTWTSGVSHKFYKILFLSHAKTQIYERCMSRCILLYKCIALLTCILTFDWFVWNCVESAEKHPWMVWACCRNQSLQADLTRGIWLRSAAATYWLQRRMITWEKIKTSLNHCVHSWGYYCWYFKNKSQKRALDCIIFCSYSTWDMFHQSASAQAFTCK